MPEFRMPSLGADMTEGTVLQWLVHPGDTVHPGDVVAEVDTTKAAIEVECFDDGVIGEILVPEGATVPVGTPLATIEPAGAAAPAAVVASPSSLAPQPPPIPEPVATAAVSPVHPVAELADAGAAAPREPAVAHDGNGEVPDVRATPLIRRLATEAGIDLHTVHGTAPGGRIVRADVLRAAAAAHGGKESDEAGEPPRSGAVAEPRPARKRPERSRTRSPRAKRAATAAPVPDSAGAPSEQRPRKHREGTRARPGGDGHRQAPPAARPASPADTPTGDGTSTAAVQASRRGERAGIAPVAPGSETLITPPPEVAGVRPAATAPVRASGYARRLARELNVELSAVPGTGPDGAVRAADVRAAQRIPVDGSVRAGEGVATGAAGAEGGRAVPALPEAGADSGTAVAPVAWGVESIGAAGNAGADRAIGRDRAAMRSLIAAAMTHSKRTVPHYYLSVTIDMAAAMAWLHEVNLRAPVADRVLAPALLSRATALAARKVPQLNGFWVDDAFQPAADVHLGFVVSLRGGGIIVPTIPYADTLTVPAMMAALRGVVTRSRDARLHAADATPATLTITNLGELGVDSVYGVIAAPQVAIVGFGAITDRPCAVDGLLGVRPQLTVTLSADHRASDGAIGARFLHALADLLQHPEEL